MERGSNGKQTDCETMAAGGGAKCEAECGQEGSRAEAAGVVQKGDLCKRSGRVEEDEQHNKRQRVDDDGGRGSESVAGNVGTQLSAASSEDKGSRTTMEDVAIIDLNAEPDPTSRKLRVSFFGVFDGHGGPNSARFAGEKLHRAVLDAGLVPPEVARGDKAFSLKDGIKCVVEGFQALDSELLRESEAKDWQDGCAAVGIWVVGEKVMIGNVGDAKCVLGRISNKDGDKGELKALVLTKEHLAIYPKERLDHTAIKLRCPDAGEALFILLHPKVLPSQTVLRARIEKRGGYVSNTGRLDGRLQVSRSLGDFSLKKSGLTALPDVQCFTITERDRLMICGCDGFWNVFDPQDAVKVASNLLSEGRDVKSVTNRMINIAVRERRCTDNCTILLIQFGPNSGPNP